HFLRLSVVRCPLSVVRCPLSVVSSNGQRTTDKLTLINGQGGVIQLHDGEVDGRGKDRAYVAAAPAAVAGLGADQVIERLLAVGAPAQLLRLLRIREQLGVAVL